MPRAALFIVASLSIASVAFAQGSAPDTADCPPVVSSGSGDVIVGAKQAARAGDRVGCGQITEGSGDVLINGRPAAVMGSGTDCGGEIAGGAPDVFINGKPVARAGAGVDCPK